MQVTKAYLTLMVRLMLLVSGVKHMNLLEAFLKERLLSKQLAEIFAFEVELVKVLEWNKLRRSEGMKRGERKEWSNCTIITPFEIRKPVNDWNTNSIDKKSEI